MKRAIAGTCVFADRVEKKRIEFSLETGLITAIDEIGTQSSLETEVFGEDCLIYPAMGDIHIHAREDQSGQHLYKEDFLTASAAAIHGGVGFAADMPNNPVPPIDEISYQAKEHLAQKSLIPLCLYAGIGPKTRPLQRIVPYKVYMGPSIGHLFFKNTQELRQCLEHYRGQWVSFHCEDPEVLSSCEQESWHEDRRPERAEVLATKTALELIKEFDLKGKLCHFSTGDGLELVIQAKNAGLNVTCEVTPQHLYFSTADLLAMEEGERIKMQMNPPIRKESDRKSLLRALKNGHIDFLATDHAPHSLEEKLKGHSGLCGLDTYAPFVTWLLLEQNLSPQMVHLVCCQNPGEFLNRFLPSRGKGFGKLSVGHSASFTVLNLQRPTLVKMEDLKTKTAQSPFLGKTFPGSLQALYLHGVKLS